MHRQYIVKMFGDVSDWLSYAGGALIKMADLAGSTEFHQIYMSLVVRKPVFGIFDQVRHKPGCTAIEDG